jgi:hypothetical protein
LLSLEQSSLIDENAVVLTAHDSLINEGTTLFVTNPKEREKKARRIPVHGELGDKEVMKTCIKSFCCSRMSFICATWMQDVTQSNIFSCGTDTSLVSSDSADKQAYPQTTSLYSQYTQVADSKLV